MAGRKRKPCDGSANCYMRHVKRQEKAPNKCKRSFRIAMRRWVHTGVWAGDVIYSAADEKRYRKTTRESVDSKRKAEKSRPRD
jgi:hypothetical protein